MFSKNASPETIKKYGGYHHHIAHPATNVCAYKQSIIPMYLGPFVVYCSIT